MQTNALSERFFARRMPGKMRDPRRLWQSYKDIFISRTLVVDRAPPFGVETVMTKLLPPHNDARAALTAAAQDRILVLDGAMGTMIQQLKLDEAGYRGDRF